MMGLAWLAIASVASYQEIQGDKTSGSTGGSSGVK